MLFERAPRCRIILATFFGFQFWEKFQNFLPLRTANTFEGLVTRLEAFGPGPIRKYNFVLIEHEVNVACVHCVHTVHTFAIHQMFR